LPTILRSQDAAALANCPSLFFVAEIDVVKRPFLNLPHPGFAGSSCRCATRADDPTTPIIDKINMY
jgi:hypothetical protein